MQWPPDYNAEADRREKLDNAFCCLEDPREGFVEAYQDDATAFIQDWCWTFNPRNVGTDIPTTMPFLLFDRQIEMVAWLDGLVADQKDGLCEKSRDMGATWICVAYSVWLWLFHEGAAVGWGSRNKVMVDEIGLPDSIFEKIRITIGLLPRYALPQKYVAKQHSHQMRIINPDNGATIAGEIGDNIGRGGRKLIYFKDESAHYERPELIEAALGDNTNVQVDISSVNGPMNVFYRRRHGGFVDVFVLDWSEHPGKTQDWYDKRRTKAEAEGLLHIFAQEVDRDYAASQERVLIPPDWVRSAVDAHIKLGIKADGNKFAGLDVADEGGDKNALVTRTGIVMDHLDMWAKGDTGYTTRKAVFHCRDHGINNLQYDCVGVGSGVKAEANRLKEDDLLPDKLDIVPWSAGASPLDKEVNFIEFDLETPLNKNMFRDLKAQGGWQLRLRFERTHKAIAEGVKFDPDTMISISSGLEHRHQLEAELSQPTYSHNTAGKMIINKKPDGTPSPNMFDAAVECYWPVPTGKRAPMMAFS